MKVVTPTDEKEFSYLNKFTVFLAGGITDCVDWQNDVITELKKVSNEDTEDLVIFNPRRDYDLWYDWKDPVNIRKQIEWEFTHLEAMDAFSMFFCDGNSVQPICLYELGRYLSEIVNDSFPFVRDDTIIISCMKGYQRLNDVLIQTDLATSGLVEVKVYEDYFDAIKGHAKRILESYNKNFIKGEMYD